MERLETRELSYFVMVAEELHFGRAARRLGITQPPLSRAMKQLERRVGVALLERNSQKVALTVAGEVLFHEGKKVLNALAAATRRTQRAGQPRTGLILAMKPGGDSGLLPNILAAYEAEPEAVPVEVLICGMGEQPSLIRGGRADVTLMHPPRGSQVELTGLDTAELLVERQVVVLPRRHRLAGRMSVWMEDLRGETMPHWPGESHDGTSGPEVRDVGQLMQLIALGHTLAVVPESIRGHLRHDLVCVPVLDAAPTAVLIAWPEDSRSPALATFVRAAMAVAERERPRIAAVESADGVGRRLAESVEDGSK